MNKKFLSAILFGALMVSSTGTFVSCKDYDDDIDELTSRVDGIESQIKDLEAKINAANWITSVTPATGGFTVAFNDGSSYTITNGKDGEAGAAGTEWTISEDGFWVCNGEKTTVKAVGQDVRSVSMTSIPVPSMRRERPRRTVPMHSACTARSRKASTRHCRMWKWYPGSRSWHRRSWRSPTRPIFYP